MKKNLLIFITSYMPEVGGAEIAVKEITSRINRYNFFLICFSENKNLPKYEKIGNVGVFRINGFKFIFPLLAFLKALKLHKEYNFDSVWSIMATYAGFSGVLFKIFNPKVKFLLTLQEGDPLNVMKRKAWFVYPLFLMIFRLADSVHSLTNFLASYAKSMGHKKNISVIPNGVDILNFTKNIPVSKKNILQKNLDLKDDDFVLITTSRLVYKNAVDDVIRSLQFLPDNFKFIIVGIGPDEIFLRNLAKNLGVRDRIIFLGFVDHKDIPPLFSVSNAFIRVSRSEGFGNSFVEAMASGLPVIASPAGGIPDFISDGLTGLFACPNDPKSIAEKIRELSGDKILYEKIRLNGQKMVVSNYSWDFIANRMDREFFKDYGK